MEATFRRRGDRWHALVASICVARILATSGQPDPERTARNVAEARLGGRYLLAVALVDAGLLALRDGETQARPGGADGGAGGRRRDRQSDRACARADGAGGGRAGGGRRSARRRRCSAPPTPSAGRSAYEPPAGDAARQKGLVAAVRERSATPEFTRGVAARAGAVVAGRGGVRAGLIRAETSAAERRTWTASAAGSPSPVGIRDRDRRDRVPGVVEHRRGDRREPGRDEPVLLGVAVAARAGEQRAQLRERGRPGVVAAHERAPAREQRVDLLRRQRGEHRQPARGQLRRQPDADVGDQPGPPGRALLDHVQHVARRAGPRGGRCGSSPPPAASARSARSSAAAPGASTRDPSSNAATPSPYRRASGQVHDEPLVAQHLQQVVGARARQPEVARDRARRQRRGVAREQLEQLQRVAWRRARWACLEYETIPRESACGDRGARAVMAHARAAVTIGVGAPTRDEVVAVARHDARVELAPEALDAIARSRDDRRGARRRRATRTTASPPASARSPRCTSRPTGACSSSAA